MSKKTSSYTLIARSLRAARLSSGLTQAQLASKVKRDGVDATVIGRIERDQQKFSLSMMDAILEAIDLDLLTLLSRTQRLPVSEEAAHEKLLRSISHWDKEAICLLHEIARAMEKYKVEIVKQPAAKVLKLASRTKKSKLK